MTKLCLLGASGSIGKQTLDIIESFPADFKLISFSVGEKVHLVDGIIAAHPSVLAVSVKNETIVSAFSSKYPHIKFFAGLEGLLDMIKQFKVNLVVNALVGFVGLAPTLVAINSGYDIALANKEALVVGGELVKDALSKNNRQLYPIDSEHVALDKLLHSVRPEEVHKLILTASGGPFHHLPRHELKHVTLEGALAHPTWKMGPKITIDSATMMNKGFEIIEAYHLFDMPSDKIDVWIHPTSKIHSMLQLIDGTLLADIGLNNMHIPISYALFKRKRVKLPFLKYEPNPETLGLLTLERVNEERFPALRLARFALAKMGTYPCVLNAANEVAVEQFLSGKLRFDYIEPIVESVLENHNLILKPNYEDLLETDKNARIQAAKLVREWML